MKSEYLYNKSEYLYNKVEIYLILSYNIFDIFMKIKVMKH